MDLKPDDFPALLHSFNACTLRHVHTLWVNERYPERVDGDLAQTKAAFGRRFAYLIPGGPTFDNLHFDHDDVAAMSAERYGGSGIADNGGGVRCGNLEGYQVKGIGKNTLVGSGSDLHHTYGGFKAVYAIHEAIYAKVLSRLLPVGVAEIYGVILTGPDAAFVKGTHRGWGGLLVREPAIRPGSLLRASHFVPSAQVGATLLSDVGRVRSVNRKLIRMVGGARGMAQLLGKFLANSADQFSFARIAGIMHGALTPSNMCLDGRWIDLTNTSFLSSAENCGGGNRKTASFYEEMHEPVKMVKSMVDALARFAGYALDVKPLVNYYYECLDYGLSSHLDYLCGLPRAAFTAPDQNPNLKLLSDAVMNVLSSAPVHYDRWPNKASEREPIFELIASLFSEAVRAGEDAADGNGAVPQELVRAFRVAILQDSTTGRARDVSPVNLLIVCCITSGKRLLLSSYFFKQRLETAVNQMLAANDLAGLETFIETAVRMSTWIFNGLQEHEDAVVLLDLRSVVIKFDGRRGDFCVVLAGKPVLHFSRADQLAKWCEHTCAEIFISDDFTFLPYLRRLLAAVHLMQDEAIHAA
jgi:hypothetical protein